MNKFIPVNIPKIFKNEKRFVNHALRTNWISSEGPFDTATPNFFLL